MAATSSASGPDAEVKLSAIMVLMVLALLIIQRTGGQNLRKSGNAVWNDSDELYTNEDMLQEVIWVFLK